MAIKVPNLNNSKLSYGNFPLFNAVGGLSAYKVGSYRPQLNIDFSNDTFTNANKNLGPELVTNGTFDTDSDWTLGTGWTISGGEASIDGTQTSTSDIEQSLAGLVSGETYAIQFDITSLSAGRITYLVLGGTIDNTDLTSAGTYTVTMVAGSSNTQLIIGARSDMVGSVDNISVRKISYSPASTTAESLLTHTRAGTATYTDNTGTLQTAASGELRKNNHIWDGSSWVKRCLVEPQSTNLVLNSNSLETQTVAVTPNEPHTLSFYPGASTVDLDDTIASTAVDVFVYDTSKDSDGGAWRTGALAQASSWYNETLNTATRGSRREFPAVAVIVAEADKVTIYDGDDPTLPMWMVFPPVDGGFIRNAGTTSVVSLDGRLVVGNYRGTSGAYGVSICDFVADGFTRYSFDANYSRKPSFAVSDRSVGTFYQNGTVTPYIVSGDINDVAMTVLPDAPTDPATGLPVPTIAVATAGGVSVIKDDGTVVDITSSSAANGVANVIDFGKDNSLWYALGTPAKSMWVYSFDSLPVSDNVVSYNSKTGTVLDATSFYATAPVASDIDLLVGYTDITQNVLHISQKSIGTRLGLSLIKDDIITPSEGMVALLTSTYNTGWMNGNIKGAFLSDTDDTDLVGSDVDPGFAAYSTIGTGTWSDIGSGVYQFVDTVGSQSRPGVQYTSALTSGQRYVMQITIDAIAGATWIRFDSLDGTDRLLGVGSHAITFVSSGLAPRFRLEDTSTTASDGFTLSVVSTEIADADRSVNNNGLIVNGTVTRTPVATGADLVAYSGFSASNYLEQPYNSDLDFGTGDFSVMGWAKQSGTGIGYIVDTRNNSGDGIVLVATTEFQLALNLGSSVSGGSATDGVWRFVTGLRRSGVLELYVDGVLVDTASNTNTTSNASSTLSVGLRGGGTSPWQGSLALIRISATAPTADQILKIYNDEKVLFQDNAQATLYGASDAVTALAYDEDTDLLHVGTSAGRSIFNGLRRINNTTTGVTTAISATNGVIAEQ